MIKSILSIVIVTSLLGSGAVCTWICNQARSAAVAEQAAPNDTQHAGCHGDHVPGEPAPAAPDSSDKIDCGSCDLDFVYLSTTTTQSASGLDDSDEDPSAVGPLYFASPPPTWVLRRRFRLAHEFRLPARDILALSSILLV
jgi:hypothetical protein